MAAVRVRSGVLRIEREAAWWVQAGHPWIYRKSLRGHRRKGGLAVLHGKEALYEILDPDGDFVGHGYFCPQGAVAVRVLSRTAGHNDWKRLVDGAVKRAVDLRTRFLSPHVTAHRLLDGDAEGLSGVTVDRYGDHAVIRQFCRQADFFIPTLCESLSARTDLQGIYLQPRLQPLAGEQKKIEPGRLVWGTRAEVEQVVCEGDLRFWVDVRAPVSVGLFGDLREARFHIARLAKDADVCNCFSHTGAFSVHAAAAPHPARRVVSVDLSRKYQAWAKKNFALNEIDPQLHQFIVGDSLSVLAQMAHKKRSFDLIILDPPTFSQGKKGKKKGMGSQRSKGAPKDRAEKDGPPKNAHNRTNKGTFSVQKDYPALLDQACRVLAPDGLLLACCNTVKVTEEEFQRLLAAGARMANRRFQVVRRFDLPPDYPTVPGFGEGAYLKAVLLRVTP